MIKYYKTNKGLYKIEKTTLYSILINPFHYTITLDKQDYSNPDFLISNLLKVGAKEITEEEYNKIFTTFNYLKSKQESLQYNIKEFIKENLNE